jgi:hypothetical protein
MTTLVYSLLINSTNFWDPYTDSYGGESFLSYLTRTGPYPNAVERGKSLTLHYFTNDIWYWYESVNFRGSIFFRSSNLSKDGLKDYRVKIITRDYSQIRHLYLCCSVRKRGRRLEGKIRLPFRLARAIRPIVVIEGLEPSWAIKRALLLGRVDAQFNRASFVRSEV